MTLTELLRDLRSYDEDPGAWEEPSIYVADPHSPESEAIVEWSPAKGGLPESAGRNGRCLLYYLTSVRNALALLKPEYDNLRSAGRMEELCEILIKRVEDENPFRSRSRS